MNERGEIPETGGGPRRGKRVALTGATGFLGSHIADLLLARGYQVRASVRASSDLRWVRGKGIEIRETDLCQPGEVREFVTGTDAVIHCAGVVAARDEEGYRRGNVDTTRALLAAAAETEPQDPSDSRPHTFVLISSLAAAGPAPLQRPQSEDRPCQPITDYGRSKLTAERYVLSEGWPFRTVVLRPPSLYGPRDAAFLPLFKAAQSGWTARFGRNLSGLSLVHGMDAAAAALALLESDTASGAYFVDDGGPAASGQRGHTWERRHTWGYDFAELAAALAATFNRRIRSARIPLSGLKFVSRLVGRRLASRSTVLNRDRLADLDATGWVCCGEKLQQDTGFRPRFGLVTGFADTLAYYRRSGWLR